MKSKYAFNPSSILLMLALVCGVLNARDGLIFKDVAPVSVKFNFIDTPSMGHYMTILNTGDEIIHDVTLSNVINGVNVSVIVCDTIHPHKSASISREYIIKYLRKLGLKNDGSGVDGRGLIVTCKYYTKPTLVTGWWERNLKVPFICELVSKKTGRKYMVEFDLEPTAEDIEEAIKYFDEEKKP